MALHFHPEPVHARIPGVQHHDPALAPVRPHPETIPVHIVRWAARYLAQRYGMEPVTPAMLAEIERTIEEA